MLLPVNFPYAAFALLIAANGIGSGMFAAPNSSSIMGSVPARHRVRLAAEFAQKFEFFMIMKDLLLHRVEKSS